MNRHPVDVFSLGAGIVFLSLAVLFLLDVDLNGLMVFPLMLIVLGLLGIFAAVRAQRANDDAVREATQDQ